MSEIVYLQPSEVKQLIDIIDNIEAVINRVEGKLGRGIRNISSIYIKATMGPSIKVKMREE